MMLNLQRRRDIAPLAAAAIICIWLSVTIRAEEPLRARSVLTYAEGGSPRSAIVVPGELIGVSTTIDNLQLDEEGRSQLEIATQLLNDTGSLLYDGRPDTWKKQVPLGGDCTRVYKMLQFPSEMAEGAYVVRVKVSEPTTKRSLVQDIRIIVLDTFGGMTFAWVNEKNEKQPHSPFHIVSETAKLKFAISGATVLDDMMNVNVTISIVDKDKKPLGEAKSFVVRQGVDRGKQMNVTSTIFLNRAGEFLAHVELEDKNSVQRSEHYLPFVVLDPNTLAVPE